MDIKNCEDYVLNKLFETESELEKAKEKIDELEGELRYRGFVIDKFDRIVNQFGVLNIFSTGNKEFEVSIHSYNDDFFDEVIKRYPDLKIHDYTKGDDV